MGIIKGLIYICKWQGSGGHASQGYSFLMPGDRPRMCGQAGRPGIPRVPGFRPGSRRLKFSGKLGINLKPYRTRY